MPTNTPQSKTVSSRSGRRWLHEAKQQARTALPPETPIAPADIQELQSAVRPTNFRLERIDQAEPLPFSKPQSELAQPLVSEPVEVAAKQPEAAHEIVQVAIPFFGHLAEPATTITTPAPLVTPPMAQPILEKSPPITSDDNQATVTTDDDSGHVSPAKIGRIPASDPPPANSAISQLTDQIIERFPIDSSTILLFAGTENSGHTDETCARVAAELAGRDLGKVLLIDSDFPNCNLSNASGLRDKPGLREIIALGLDWERTILRNTNSSLDFMPAGETKQSRWNANEPLRKAAAQLKHDYSFICVTIGDAHEKAARMWSEVCDGTYLVVSIANSNQDIARSAVNVLKDSGARLQGCVVTETV